jgi:hypothetical protein
LAYWPEETPSEEKIRKEKEKEKRSQWMKGGEK